MFRVVQYSSRWQQVQGNLFGLPPWARFVVAIFAMPGIVLAVLSIVALGVSILTLLLLTVPVYQLLRAVAGTDRRQMVEATVVGEEPTKAPDVVDAEIIE